MIYFLIYFFLEVVISVNVFSVLGGIGAFIQIILTAILGIVLLANFRYSLAQGFNALATHRMSPEAFSQASIFGFIGALMLIVPGVLSDVLGVLLQFSAITTFAIQRFVPKNSENSAKEQDSIIDVEVIESNSFSTKDS